MVNQLAHDNLAATVDQQAATLAELTATIAELRAALQARAPPGTLTLDAPTLALIRDGGNGNKEKSVNLSNLSSSKGTINLDTQQTGTTLVLNIVEVLDMLYTELTLQGTFSMRKIFTVLQVLFDPVTAKSIQLKLSDYDSARETAAIESRNCDFKQDDTWASTDEVIVLKNYKRFVRYVIKYFFVAELQRKNTMALYHFVNKKNLTDVSPVRILELLEQYRTQSLGADATLVISRATIFIAFKAILARASPRHLQAYTHVTVLIETEYKLVEFTSTGDVNPNAEAKHVSAMGKIAREAEQYFKAASNPPMLIGVNNVQFNELFDGQASEANGSLFDSTLFNTEVVGEVVEDKQVPSSALINQVTKLTNMVEELSEQAFVNNTEVDEDTASEYVNDLRDLADEFGVSMAVVANIVARNASTDRNKVACFRCGENHYIRDCPENSPQDRRAVISNQDKSTNWTRPRAPATQANSRRFSSMFTDRSNTRHNRSSSVPRSRYGNNSNGRYNTRSRSADSRQRNSFGRKKFVGVKFDARNKPKIFHIQTLEELESAEAEEIFVVDADQQMDSITVNNVQLFDLA